MLILQWTLPQINSIVRRTMKEADRDEDSLIDFTEFKQVHLLKSTVYDAAHY